MAFETGKGGYKHVQARIKINDSNDEQFTNEIRQLGGHLDKSSGEYNERYERKSGIFWSYSDTMDIIRQRFYPLRESQARVTAHLRRTNDRELVLWYDPIGNVGKSWLIGALWERGKAYYVPCTGNAGGMIKDVANEYIENGYRPYVVIDVPRTAKWTQDLYLAIESIKDGLLKDPRYNSRTVNIRGVKVLVATNTKPKFDKLSSDRWKVVNREGVLLP